MGGRRLTEPTWLASFADFLYFQVANDGHKQIGPEAIPSRDLQVQILFPAKYGSLLVDGRGIAGEVTMEMPTIGPKATGCSTQTIQISREVRGPIRFNVTLGLYLSDAAYYSADEGNRAAAGPDLVLVQLVQVPLQISDLYQYNPASEILMVVNGQTAPHRMIALQNFIEQELGMAMDCWDVDLNGGLQCADDGIDDPKGERRFSFRTYKQAALLVSVQSSF